MTPGDHGNVSRVIKKIENPDPGQPRYEATRFDYALNGKAVTSVVGETWNDDGPDPYDFADDYTVTFAREFRYDGPRERYLVREFDGAALTADP